MTYRILLDHDKTYLGKLYMWKCQSENGQGQYVYPDSGSMICVNMGLENKEFAGVLYEGYLLLA